MFELSRSSIFISFAVIFADSGSEISMNDEREIESTSPAFKLLFPSFRFNLSKSSKSVELQLNVPATFINISYPAASALRGVVGLVDDDGDGSVGYPSFIELIPCGLLLSGGVTVMMVVVVGLASVVECMISLCCSAQEMMDSPRTGRTLIKLEEMVVDTFSASDVMTDIVEVVAGVFGKSGSTRGITTLLKFGRLPSLRFPLGKSKNGFGGGNSTSGGSFAGSSVLRCVVGL